MNESVVHKQWCYVSAELISVNDGWLVLSTKMKENTDDNVISIFRNCQSNKEGNPNSYDVRKREEFQKMSELTIFS